MADRLQTRKVNTRKRYRQVMKAMYTVLTHLESMFQRYFLLDQLCHY